MFYRNDLAILPSFKTTGLSVQEKKRKTDFQDSSGCYLGFPIGTIFAFFDLQVTLSLPTKIQVNWHFGSGKEAKKKKKKKKKKNNFQDGGHGGQLGFPIGTILSIFYL